MVLPKRLKTVHVKVPSPLKDLTLVVLDRARDAYQAIA
jgi:hypothetical protein